MTKNEAVEITIRRLRENAIALKDTLYEGILAMANDGQWILQIRTEYYAPEVRNEVLDQLKRDGFTVALTLGSGKSEQLWEISWHVNRERF